MSALRSATVARPPRARSAVSNGSRLHVQPVGDTAWSRRFRDVFAQIVSDLGGADYLSEGQRQLARRAATISLECEKLEARAVGGNQIDLDVYGQLTDRLGRAFQRLGLKRVPKDVTPTLTEYLARAPSGHTGSSDHEAEAEIVPDDETPAGEPATASVDDSAQRAAAELLPRPGIGEVEAAAPTLPENSNVCGQASNARADSEANST
jgi:hypothetical protein